MLLGFTHIERFNKPETIWSFSPISKEYSVCDQATTANDEQGSHRDPGKIGIEEFSG